jgi:hypothetical protein
MARAGQTPHGARPNREEVRGFDRGHVPARCVKPSGRSLEPRSDARPRGMAVQQEQSRGQNSAYRSGCHKILLSSASPQIRPILAHLKCAWAKATTFSFPYTPPITLVDFGCARCMVPFPRGRLRLHSKYCLGRPDRHPSGDGCVAALCLRPHHSLGYDLVFLCPAH